MNARERPPAFSPDQAPSPNEPPVSLPAHPAPTSPPPAPDDITAMDALSLSRQIATRQLSCREVMSAYLARIDQVNPGYNAIVARRDTDALLRQAHEYDQELAAGRSRGWLHGLPMAPKDITAVAGMVTTRGSPLFVDNITVTDSLQVARQRQEGAILIGRTNVPEFGLGSHTFNDVYGATRNALNPALSAGGSSGGAAVAVALNLLPVADGSDMMGSLRNPAAFNGVWGYRPSFGRVPAIDMPDLFIHQLVVDGPIGRTPLDCARLLATQAGHDPRSPLALAGDGSEFLALAELDSGRMAARPMVGKRIGWLGDLDGYLAMEPGLMPVVQNVLADFEALGAIVEPIALGFAPERLWSSWLALRQCLQGGNLLPLALDPAQRRRIKPEAQWEAQQAQLGSMADLFQASADRTAFFQAMLGLFAKVDFLALPSAQVFPFPITQRWPAQIAGRTMDTYHRWMEVVLPATMAGLPTMSVPARPDPVDGWPTRIAGLQLIGRPQDDVAVLQASIQLHLASRSRA